MDNNEVATVLDKIGDLLELEDESTFRVGAYRRAAQVIRGLPQDINELDGEGRLTQIAGIGKGIAERLAELLKTGRMTYFEELKQRTPESLTILMQIPGLGPKRARLVYERLGIETIDQLKAALADKRLRKLSGMGAKTEANVVRGLQQYERRTSRLLLSQAVPAAEKLVAYLSRQKAVEAVAPAGSLRRWAETVGDIDILCSTREPLKVGYIFCSHPDVAHILARGASKCSIILSNGLQVDLRLIKPHEYGAALQYFTGSKRHNIRLRELAKKQGLKLSEYGVFSVDSGERRGGRSEQEVYELIGLVWMPPELREDKGEIEAAADGSLPRLIELGDLRGDLHTHTSASDGRSRLEEMARAARSLGYEYLVVSDHALNLKVAGGLSIDEVTRQWTEIDKFNASLDGFTLLKGIELNIDNQGLVDFADDILAGFDVVTASLHTGFNQDMKQLTDRLLAVIHNPHVDVIAHPTGRILGKRPAYNLDFPAIFNAAAKTGTVLELNAFPDRLDLKDDYLMEAKRLGCRFAVNTDAHHSGQLTYARYGIAMARRGWLEARDVINTFPLKKLRTSFGRDVVE